jgi:hypothetical protein
MITIRDLADTLDVMQYVYWTPWQAVAWIAYHDADRVRECTDDWRDIGPHFHEEGAPLRPFRAIWNEDCNYEVTKARGDLWRALEAETLTAYGVDGAGVARQISGLELLDLEFVGIDRAEPQLYRKQKWNYENLDTTAPAFRNVLVRVADVLKEFPVKPPVPDPSARRRGRRPSKMPEVLAAMRKADPEELLHMKEERMAATYGAARSTCRDARNQVLGIV